MSDSEDDGISIHDESDESIDEESASDDDASAADEKSDAEPPSDSDNQSYFPEWSWDHVRPWVAIRRIDKYSDEQIRALAAQDIVMLEKANGCQTYGSVEEGTLAAARRIKAINPKCKVLFYHNSMVHYTGYNFRYAAYKDFKDEWAVVDPDTGRQFKWGNKWRAYNHTNLEFREWWIQRALDMCAHDVIDGVFIDAIVKAELNRKLKVKNHSTAYFATATELRARLPTGKLLIGNALRLGRGGPTSGLRHLAYLDGSYLEQWCFPNKHTTKLVGTLELMTAALKQRKIIMLTAEPTHLDEKKLKGLDSLDERYAYVGKPQFIGFTLGFFLLIVEPHAYFSYRTGVDAKPGKKCCFDNTRFEAITRSLGRPVSDYVKESEVEYSREFEHLTVHVNLLTQEGVLTVKDDKGEEL